VAYHKLTKLLIICNALFTAPRTGAAERPYKDVMPLLMSLLMPLVWDIKRDIVRTPGIMRDIVWPNGPLGPVLHGLT